MYRATTTDPYFIIFNFILTAALIFLIIALRKRWCLWSYVTQINWIVIIVVTWVGYQVAQILYGSNLDGKEGMGLVVAFMLIPALPWPILSTHACFSLSPTDFQICSLLVLVRGFFINATLLGLIMDTAHSLRLSRRSKTSMKEEIKRRLNNLSTIIFVSLTTLLIVLPAILAWHSIK